MYKLKKILTFLSNLESDRANVQQTSLRRNQHTIEGLVQFCVLQGTSIKDFGRDIRFRPLQF